MIWRNVLTRTFLSRCIGAAASLGYGLLLADVLAPGVMGEFTVAVSVALIAATVSKCGLDAYLMRNAVGRLHAMRDLTLRCLIITGLMGALTCSLCVWAGTVLRPGTGAAFNLMLLGIPFMAMGYVLAGLLKAGEFPAAAIFLETGAWQSVMCACAILMLLVGSDSPIIVAACFVAGSAFAFTVFLAVAMHFFFRGMSSAVITQHAVSVRLREVAPLSGVDICNVLMRWTDTLWIAWYLDARDVAVYVVCTRLAGGIVLAENVVNAIAAPRFALQHRRGEAQALSSELRSACATSATLAAIGATALALLGPFVLEWLGTPYSGGVRVLQLAVVAMAVQVALTPVGHLAAMSGRASDHCKAMGLALALQQLAYLLFIPKFGMTAALFGFALSRTLAYLITLALLRHRGEFNQTAA